MWWEDPYETKKNIESEKTKKTSNSTSSTQQIKFEIQMPMFSPLIK